MTATLSDGPQPQWGRRSGVLLPIASLPGPWGLGDLGPEAHVALSALHDAGQRTWQILPLHPPDAHGSPYASPSAFALDPLLLSPTLLVQEGWLAQDFGALDALRSAARAGDPRRILWPVQRQLRGAVVEEAARGLLAALPGDTALRDEFTSFQRGAEAWLAPWSWFAARREAHRGLPWWRWNLDDQDVAGLEAKHEALQFLVHRQWTSFRGALRQAGMELLGDLPLFVALDSADVVQRPELFQLDGEGRPTAVAGVPGDAFQPEGQKWGNPLYRWDACADEGYGWWIDRLAVLFQRVDRVRIDHFRGLVDYWAIPPEAPDGTVGQWHRGPGRPFFDAVLSGGALDLPRGPTGQLPLVAEDLGFITEDVEALRQELQLPGIRVAQFGFDGSAANPHHPAGVEAAMLVTSGTHDNDTTRGWLDGATAEQLRRVQSLPRRSGESWVDAIVRGVAASAAELCILPLQDVLEMGSEHRINTPGTVEGNWDWRLLPSELEPACARLLAVCEESGRLARERPR